MAETAYGLSAEALASLSSMEGVYELPFVETRPDGTKPKPASASPWPGYLLSIAVAALAYGIHYLPFAPFRIAGEHGARRPISASIIAILLGLAAGNLWTLPASIVDAAKRIVKRVIPVTIILTGAGLNLAAIASVGLPALFIVLASMTIASLSAYYFGRVIALAPRTSLLIGVGTSICGTSAIVAVAPLIDAEDEDLALSIGTVNILGLALMVVLPFLGGMLHLTNQAFGIWAGATIHAVPQVVAAGFAYGFEAGTLATMVKLVRVALLAPFIFICMLLYARRHGGERGVRGVSVHYTRLVPPFVWGFAGLALLNTMSLIPALHFQPAAFLMPGVYHLSIQDGLVELGNWLLAIAMAAMGLELNIRFLAKVGTRALLTGAIACALLCAGALLLIRLLV